MEIGWRMPRIEVAGNICLKTSRSIKGCRSDDAVHDGDGDGDDDVDDSNNNNNHLNDMNLKKKSY